MSQQYCLRWNNHQHNLLSVFEDLLHHEAFVDVTLACDGLQLKAHKMVLSACSPYFQSMLYGTPDRHPIVFLRDVRYHEMKALLEFMYRGEVSVDQDNLSSLLKVAEGLKIKGLAEVHEQKQQQQAAMAGLLTLQQSSPGAHMFSGLMSPAGGNPAGSGSSGNKRSGSPQPQSNNPQSSSQSAQYALGPKRKRGRPRRLSGSEAVPMASGMGDNTDRNEDLHVQTEDMNTKLKEEKVRINWFSGFFKVREGFILLWFHFVFIFLAENVLKAKIIEIDGFSEYEVKFWYLCQFVFVLNHVKSIMPWFSIFSFLLMISGNE